MACILSAYSLVSGKYHRVSFSFAVSISHHFVRIKSIELQRA